MAIQIVDCGPVRLAAHDISKSFGPTLANDRVSLTVAAGEIVGLVGENGAGKSTLLSILAGFLRPDSGLLAVDGQAVAFTSPADSLDAGIGLVHQHLSLVLSFTVREQLALAGWTSTALPKMLASDFRGDEVIEQLSMGQRQRVEIARALVREPRILLLDEPTSILAPSEVDALFEALGELRRSGIAIVIVTHKVREVMSIADRVVTMAGGQITGIFGRDASDWAPDAEHQMLERMFAWTDPPRSNLDAFPETPGRSDVHETAREPSMLRLFGVGAASRHGSRRLVEVGFDLPPGQIHAFVGIDGQGQTELAEVIAGYREADGAIELAGQDVQPLCSTERAERGIALLTDDRLGEGAIRSMSIADNLVLKRPRSRTLVGNAVFRRRQVRDHARRLIEAWAVQPASPEARFDSLSGGNMQRVLAARELDRNPRLLIALNPVQGLDARTAEFLWSQFRSLCERGGAVLFFTTDLDEALARADRCGVIHDGRVSPMLPLGQADKRAYGSMMVNGW